ncbi:MAG: hypothetical protein HKN00_07060 [Flavobacteriaceae bacterium]|nr:hypothetical protein [Bacteroidia bacterium]MBT8288757.1 hypothetical protein [Bacteroidia bacterium]NNF74925.1 hypothetical protein [Flavobacteriaceae bacterium]NNK72827.1 hypothetical protein [Flavobacteriaceae bacterium]
MNKRLIICGYSPIDLLAAILCALILIIIFISTYVGLLILFFHDYSNVVGLMIGLSMIGFVYGCYGLLVGSLLKKELEGILMIVLLANIDVGWLQNPVFYSQAENQTFIQYLPGYFPSQSAVIQAFTDFSSKSLNTSALLYGAILLLISMIIYFFKMKTSRN